MADKIMCPDFVPETSAEEYAILVGKVTAVISYLEYRDKRGDDISPDEILAMLKR